MNENMDRTAPIYFYRPVTRINLKKSHNINSLKRSDSFLNDLILATKNLSYSKYILNMYGIYAVEVFGVKKETPGVFQKRQAKEAKERKELERLKEKFEK